jgi:hypothetical protein
MCIDINTFNIMPKKTLKTHFLKLQGRSLGLRSASRSSYDDVPSCTGEMSQHVCGWGVASAARSAPVALIWPMLDACSSCSLQWLLFKKVVQQGQRIFWEEPRSSSFACQLLAA